MLDPEIVFTIHAIGTAYKANETYIERAAWGIVGLQLEEATRMLADEIGKSVDWVEARAHAYQLKKDIEDANGDFIAEFGATSATLRNLPESYFTEVGKKYCAKDHELKLNLGEAFSKLVEYTQPTATGQAWTIEKVRADLPHSERDIDYLDAWRKMLPQIIRRLIKTPALGLPENVYKSVCGHLQRAIDEIKPYLSNGT